MIVRVIYPDAFVVHRGFTPVYYGNGQCGEEQIGYVVVSQAQAGGSVIDLFVNENAFPVVTSDLVHDGRDSHVEVHLRDSLILSVSLVSPQAVFTGNASIYWLGDWSEVLNPDPLRRALETMGINSPLQD